MSLDLTLPSKHGLKLGARGEEVARLQRLLIDLGYMRHLDGERLDEGDPGQAVAAVDHLGEFDQATARALGAFQHNRGLRASEVLDEATLVAMGQIFCRSKPPILTMFFDVPKRIYRYQILNDHPALPGSDLPRAIEQAFAMWAVETPLAFMPAAVDTTPDITFKFAPNVGFGNALIEFDEDRNWVLGPSNLVSQVDFISIAVHEIGHRLGLKHSDMHGSVMWEDYSYGDRYRILHPVDIAEVRTIHGAPTVRHSLWLHGTSVVAEKAAQLDLYQPKGPLALVVGKSGVISSWFHFAVPTPVVDNETTARLHGVRLKLRTYPDSEITQVHIWDGNTFLAKHLLNLGGSPSEDMPRQWDLRLGVARKPLIKMGVGISVQVKFALGTALARRVEFVAAGAEFVERQLEEYPLEVKAM